MSRRAVKGPGILEPGTYLWASPHGYTYLRDHLGTLDVTMDHPRHPSAES